jgi:hypothetical protein
LSAVRSRDFGAVVRGLAAFAASRLAAVGFAGFVDVIDVLLAIAFIPNDGSSMSGRGCLRFAASDAKRRLFDARRTAAG